jgi:hypothetical protein
MKVKMVGRFEVAGVTVAEDDRVDVDAKEMEDGKEEVEVEGGRGTSAGSAGCDGDGFDASSDFETAVRISGGTYPRRIATPPLFPYTDA